MKRLLTLVLVSFAGLSCFSQSSLKEVTPESAGFSSDRLNRIDNVFQEYIDKKWIAGGAAIIAKDGKIVYYKALGYDDIENKTALKTRCYFSHCFANKSYYQCGHHDAV